MTTEVIREAKLCPKWFQDAVTQAGGLNAFGGPNFDVVWSQTATELLADGEVLQYKGEPPCWLLRKWFPPEDYGSRIIWESRGDLLGAYPERGRYEIIQPFILHSVVNGRLKKETFPLSPALFEHMVLVLRRAMDVTEDQMRRELKDHQAKKDAAQQESIADALQNASPQFTGPTSFPTGDSKTLVQKKMDQIERNQANADRMRRKHGKGISLEN